MNANSVMDLNATENLQNHLVQIEFVFDLLFIRDLSHLLTFCSKEFQRFDVMPFYSKAVYEKLKCQLESAQKAFNIRQIPHAICVQGNDQMKTYVWKNFSNGVKSIIESHTFQNVRLLTRSERGRVTRSGNIFGCDRGSYDTILHQKYRSYAIYLLSFIKQLEYRFEPWPAWVNLSDDAFNFQNSLEFEDRKQSFECLLDLPHGSTPLLNDEKERLKAEYETLHLNAMTTLKNLDCTDRKSLIATWYTLLTDEKMYKDCKLVNHIALKYLNRSFNECIVESAVSSAEDVEDKKDL